MATTRLSIPQSSNAKAAFYDPESMELTIEYSRGHKYVYRQVSGDTVEALKQADSVGKFLQQYVHGLHMFDKEK